METWKRWSSVNVSIANRVFQQEDGACALAQVLQQSKYSRKVPQISPFMKSGLILVLHFTSVLIWTSSVISAYLTPTGPDNPIMSSSYSHSISSCPEALPVSDWDSCEQLSSGSTYRWVFADLRFHLYYKMPQNKYCCLIGDSTLLKGIIYVLLQQAGAWEVQIFCASFSLLLHKRHRMSFCQAGLLTGAHHCASRATQLLGLHPAHKGNNISLPSPGKTQAIEMFASIACSLSGQRWTMLFGQNRPKGSFIFLFKNYIFVPHLLKKTATGI